MKLGLHTYSLNLHGIGQDWAGFKWPWPKVLCNPVQISVAPAANRTIYTKKRKYRSVSLL